MKTSFYRFKSATLVVTLVPTVFLIMGCGGSKGSASPELSALIMQTTSVDVPMSSAPTEVTNGDTSTITMTLGSRPVSLTEADKKAFADNLQLGPKTDQATIFKGANKSDIQFNPPQTVIVWYISHDENPGVLFVNKYEGVRGQGAKVISNEYFELSESANSFARDWLAAHPQ